MSYIYEVISLEDQAGIIDDAGERLASLYRERQGYFRPYLKLGWAVDREQRSYLLVAPIIEAKREIPTFHFFFCQAMYTIKLVGIGSKEVCVSGGLREEHMLAFRDALIEAFTVLGAGTGYPYSFSFPASLAENLRLQFRYPMFSPW